MTLANREHKIRNRTSTNVIRSKLLASSWRVKFFEDTVVSPSGRTHQFARFETPDFVIAVATRADGKIPLVRQYRNGPRAMFWELPAGLLEPKESPVACIKREFREETGFELREPRLIASVFSAPARTGQKAHIFKGIVGKKLGNQSLDETEEDLKVKFVGEKEALRLLRRRISSTHLLAYLITRRKR